VIVPIVDNGGIVDDQCLNFLFIIKIFRVFIMVFNE